MASFYSQLLPSDCTTKLAEGGEGEMAVTAVVQQVSAVGCHESVADLPAIPLVANTALCHHVSRFHSHGECGISVVEPC